MPARSSSMGAMAAAPPTAFLAQVGLFSDLSPRELKAIAGSMREHRYPAGREVVAEGKPGVAFFVIADGAAVVMRAGGGVATLGPGVHFGEIALITEVERTASVTAQTDLVCWTLTSWVFRSIVKANPPIAWKLLQRLGRLVGSS